MQHAALKLGTHHVLPVFPNAQKWEFQVTLDFHLPITFSLLLPIMGPLCTHFSCCKLLFYFQLRTFNSNGELRLSVCETLWSLSKFDRLLIVTCNNVFTTFGHIHQLHLSYRPQKNVAKKITIIIIIIMCSLKNALYI